MKKTLILLLFLLTGLLVFAQQPMSKVVLKSGVTVTGTIKEFNPTSHVILVVGGVETKISMSEVNSIEEIQKTEMQLDTRAEKSVIQEAVSSYPERFDLRIGPFTVKMILIKGGTFSMGYDGNGSMSLNSEPVHSVALHSFYVSEQPIDNVLANYVWKGKDSNLDYEYSKAFSTRWSDDIVQVVDRLANLTNIQVGLITEAQWEYIATTQRNVFIPGERNVCYDYYASFSKKQQTEIDPIGPTYGEAHVIRVFANDQDVYGRQPAYRRKSVTGLAIEHGSNYKVRISFPAEKVHLINATAALVGRSVMEGFPVPEWGDKKGIVVVDVHVDQNGTVIDAIPGGAGTSVQDKEMLDLARRAALKTHFNQSVKAPALQIGQIVYYH